MKENCAGNKYPAITSLLSALTNNLSLVVFLRVGEMTVLLPGDLECVGWEKLLELPAFRTQLRTVNVFVASHHGRESGYCADVFAAGLCTPDAVVFSDSAIKHATQEMASTYGRRAIGVTFNGEDRTVLTTRNDGDILWQDL